MLSTKRLRLWKFEGDNLLTLLFVLVTAPFSRESSQESRISKYFRKNTYIQADGLRIWFSFYFKRFKTTLPHIYHELKQAVLDVTCQWTQEANDIFSLS